jgi:phosphinothricin acetyltransferase
MPQAASAVLVRASRDEDVPAIAEIYRYHVVHGSASFEVEPPSAEEMSRRRRSVLERGLPCLVAEADGAVQGFAYAGPYRARAAYRFTVEDSVYVHVARMGQGIGRLLLAELIAACERAGCRQMVAVIGGDESAASIALHQSLGFRRVGTLAKVGFKFGRWLDTVLMQRPLGEGDGSLPRQSSPR